MTNQHKNLNMELFSLMDGQELYSLTVFNTECKYVIFRIE